MNPCTVQYRKKLIKTLKCCDNAKKRLTEKFDKSLAVFLEDCPNPTREDLVRAFGEPSAMAETLNQDLTPTETKQFRTKRLVIRIVAGILAALFILFALYAFFKKDVPLHSDDEVEVIDRTDETSIAE